jgi:hypothetical protein
MGQTPREEKQTLLVDLRDLAEIPLAENTGSNPLGPERNYGRNSPSSQETKPLKGRD